MRKVKVIDLYSGGGGISEGCIQAGVMPSLAIDINKDCIESIKLNHPDCEVIHGKVGDYIKSFSKGSFDAVVGGPPCPAFSRARMNKRSFDPEEVNNFWKVVDQVKPKWYLMENVRDVIKVCARDPNYLLDSSKFGVPQKRIRRFFSNLPQPKPTFEINVQDAIGFKGFVEDRKSTFGEKYGKVGGKFRRRESTRPCYTITKDYRVWLIDNSGERKATEQEVAIIQGFPEDYKFFGTKKSVRDQIGNAVPPTMIKEIILQGINKIPEWTDIPLAFVRNEKIMKLKALEKPILSSKEIRRKKIESKTKND